MRLFQFFTLRRRQLLRPYDPQLQALLLHHGAPQPVPAAPRSGGPVFPAFRGYHPQLLQPFGDLGPRSHQVQLFPCSRQPHIQDAHLLLQPGLAVLQLHGRQRQGLMLQHGVVIPQLAGKAQLPVHGDVAALLRPAEPLIAPGQEHHRVFQSLAAVNGRHGHSVAAGGRRAGQHTAPLGQPPQVFRKVTLATAVLFVLGRMGLQQPQVGHRGLAFRQHPALFPVAGHLAYLPDQLSGGQLLHFGPQQVVVPQECREFAALRRFAQQVLVQSLPPTGRSQGRQIVPGKAVHRACQHLGQLQVQHGVGQHGQVAHHRFYLSYLQQVFVFGAPGADAPFPQGVYVVLLPVFGAPHQDADIPRPNRPSAPVFLHGKARLQQYPDLLRRLLGLHFAAVGHRGPHRRVDDQRRHRPPDGIVIRQ